MKLCPPEHIMTRMLWRIILAQLPVMGSLGSWLPLTSHNPQGGLNTHISPTQLAEGRARTCPKAARHLSTDCDPSPPTLRTGRLAEEKPVPPHRLSTPTPGCLGECFPSLLLGVLLSAGTTWGNGSRQMAQDWTGTRSGSRPGWGNYLCPSSSNTWDRGRSRPSFLPPQPPHASVSPPEKWGPTWTRPPCVAATRDLSLATTKGQMALGTVSHVPAKVPCAPLLNDDGGLRRQDRVRGRCPYGDSSGPARGRGWGA